MSQRETHSKSVYIRIYISRTASCGAVVVYLLLDTPLSLLFLLLLILLVARGGAIAINHMSASPPSRRRRRGKERKKIEIRRYLYFPYTPRKLEGGGSHRSSSKMRPMTFYSNSSWVFFSFSVRLRFVCDRNQLGNRASVQIYGIRIRFFS